MNKQIAAYFAAIPDQRNAILDKQIQEMEKRRKEWEARRIDQMGQSQNGGTTGQAGQSQNANAGGGPRGVRATTPEAMEQRRNQHLDHSTPQQRAQRTAYFPQAVQQHRIALGLPAFSGHHGH